MATHGKHADEANAPEPKPKPAATRKKKPAKRYWEPEKFEDVKINKTPLQQSEGEKPERRKVENIVKQHRFSQSAKVRSSRSKDVFFGPAPLPEARVKRYQRGEKFQLKGRQPGALRELVTRAAKNAELASQQTARCDLLLPETQGFIEPDEGEETSYVTQRDIQEAVDITSASKSFELDLNQFGPYRVDYTATGRHLLLGGTRGHVAAFDWVTKSLMCEMNVMETVKDIKWLHTESMFAVAQLHWVYVYDSQGIELHCLKRFHNITRMEFLPYHFLLATASSTGYLQYLDVSIGKEISTINTKGGSLQAMCTNPSNAIVNLGHHNGYVTMWTPTMKEPLVKMMCHRGAVRSIAVERTGTYMATSGLDHKLRVWDVRTFRPLHSYVLSSGASNLDFSHRSLLAATCGNVVQVYKDTHLGVGRPYLTHVSPHHAHSLKFCPYEDVLGLGHGNGFTSLLVPGAGEPNFDAMEANPLRSKKQRQEWEVKALLEKIQPELITLDPAMLSKVDTASFETKYAERVQRLGFDPKAPTKFEPRFRTKGRSSTANRELRKRIVAGTQKRETIKASMEEKQKKQKEKIQSNETEAKGGALQRFKK
ncbi:unnamed protein product [Lampetra planeri]